MKINEWKLYKMENDESEENDNEISLEKNDDFYEINLNNIFNNKVNKEHVLCVGQVQSGKTRNIEKTITKAINDNYKLIIVFSGITKILLEQTNSRISNFKENRNVKFIEKLKKVNLFNAIENYKTVIWSLLKSAEWLNNAFEEIDLINWEDYKVLIIDDECDYASINISSGESSRIYTLISDLYNRFYNVKLLSFTGTPFANIMSSKSNLLKIDRVVTLLNYDSYCGIKFFNDNSDFNYVTLNIQKESLDSQIFYVVFWYWLIQTACALSENNEFKSELIVNVEIENINQENIILKFYEAYHEIWNEIINKSKKWLYK
ncbi:MAG: DEAD/DEAH box helicase family protein, partial [Malacoplasma sp.]|nr:DEAD/DEAH box helicase family protein [Malacoplasma sp.]